MEEILVKKRELILLTKLSDDKFNGFHPNGINEGYQKVGHLYENIEIGNKVVITNGLRCFNTSTVTAIIDKNTFKTENSTYKIEKYSYEGNQE